MNNDQQTQTAVPQSENGSMIGSVAADIRTAATEKFGQAVTEVRAKANDAKAGMADEVKDVATVLRRASEDLRGGSAQERTLGSIASGLADVSDAIRDKDLGEIVQMVSKVARENPVLYLGGAALLGFAASRYAKASGSAAPMTSPRETRAQVEAFVDEGNPNTQPMHPAA
jgi:hypothetical protein